MDPWFEDSMSSKHMDKWNIGDKVERCAHAIIPTESLTDPKMEEQKIQSVTVWVLPSPKKQDVSNLASRQFNSIRKPHIKAYVAQKGEAEKYEYKSKGIRVNKYCATPTKKNSRGLNKDHGKYNSKNFNEGQLAKQLYVFKHEKVSPIKYGIETSLEKVTGSLKFKVKINGTTTMKLYGVSLSIELHLEK